MMMPWISKAGSNVIRFTLVALVLIALRVAAPAKEASMITRFSVQKVTYLTLTPDVTMTLGLKVPEAGRRIQLEYAIRELTRGVTLALDQEERMLSAGDFSTTKTVSLRLDKMMGLLASVRVVDALTGEELGRAERPFDVTNDLRTNFRYAGETYGGVDKALDPVPIGEGQTDMDFWSGVPVGTKPEDEIRALHRCFLNAAQVSVEEGRGHFTCWEEGHRTEWTKSAYLTKDFWLFSLTRIQKLYKEGPEAGIYILPWTSVKGIRQEYLSPDFPWLDPYQPTNYYPGCYLMNLDPSYRRPLTDAEKKMSKFDLHGADSWLEYMAEELYRITDFYDFQVMWWDNSYGTTHIPYTLNLIRNKWAERRPNVRPPYVMVNGEAGYESDIYWMENNLPPTMDAYLAYLRQVIEDHPTVKNGPATITSGQFHPMMKSGQREAIKDPGNIYNDPSTTFMFRQLLFECISLDGRIVNQQQWPRNALEWRILHFPETFKDHQRTWGFQTLFEHVYNARDIRPYPAAAEIKVADIPTSLENTVEDGKLHIVARSPLSDPDTIYLHVFNYTGTTMQILDRRPRPTPHNNVTITLPLPGFARDYEVKVFSPDFANYSDELNPTTTCEGQMATFSIPVDLYTLVVIRKKWL